MADIDVLVSEIKDEIRNAERERKRQLSRCWGMPSGLEPREFEEAIERKKRLVRWLKLLGVDYEED